MYKKGTLAYLIFAFCLGAMALLAADSPNDTTTTTDNTATTADTASPSSDPASAPAVEGPLSRWLQLNTLSFGMRYRNTSDFDGFHLFHFGQERSLIDGAVKLDAQGKYQIHFHASSGRYFNWAYADEIGGNFEVAPNSLARFHPNMLPLLGESVVLDNAFFELTQKHLDSRGWQIYLRQLYASATPIKQITVEYGGLGIERGLNSEMTTYDDDGYMTGGRLRIKDPDHLFFDQLAATFGYVGDIYFPNIFDRGNRFLQSNYHQFLAEKKLKGHFDASVDYTEHFGTHTLREGILVNTAKSRLIDSVRGEFYQRTNDVVLQTIKFDGGSGWGFTGANLTFALRGRFPRVPTRKGMACNVSFLKTAE